MKKLIIIITVLLISGLAFADDNRILIDEANKNYSDDNFDQAIEMYQKVIENGYESTELYFNLGNAYFKLNNIPSAILYYEKAKKLDPLDKDILFNLQIANNRIVDKIETVPDIFYQRWWNMLVYSLTVEEWGWISLISFALIFIMLLFFLLSNMFWLKKMSFWMGLLFILFSGTSYLLANQKYNSFKKDHQAIVFTPTVTVKSSPSETGIDLFVIHEGTKVLITDHIGIWYEVEIANGSVGWIQESDLIKI